jgi:hypothetical protein
MFPAVISFSFFIACSFYNIFVGHKINELNQPTKHALNDCVPAHVRLVGVGISSRSASDDRALNAIGRCVQFRIDKADTLI